MKTFSFTLHWKLMTGREFFMLYLLGFAKFVAMVTIKKYMTPSLTKHLEEKYLNPLKHQRRSNWQICNFPSVLFIQTQQIFGHQSPPGNAKFPKLTWLSLTFLMCSLSLSLSPWAWQLWRSTIMCPWENLTRLPRNTTYTGEPLGLRECIYNHTKEININRWRKLEVHHDSLFGRLSTLRAQQGEKYFLQVSSSWRSTRKQTIHFFFIAM